MNCQEWIKAKFYSDSGIPEPTLATVRFCEEAWEASKAEERERCASLCLKEYRLVGSTLAKNVCQWLAEQIRKGE